MDFTLSEEHLMAQQMVRDFAQKEIAPTIAEWDRRQEVNPAILPRMAELGILGINIPVRPPVELLLYRTGVLHFFRQQTFDLDTPFYAAVKEEWQNALRRALVNLPRFDWE